MSTSNLSRDLAALRIDRSRSAARGSSRWKGVVVALIVIGLLGGAGAFGYSLLKDRLAPRREVKTGVVKLMTSGQVSTVLSATGYLESRFQASVGSKVPGRVSEVFVSEGQKVKKGDLLAVLEHDDLDAALVSRQAAQKQAEAELAEAQRNMEQRRRDYEREKTLRAKNAGTEAALETAETNWQVAEVNVQALQAAVEVAQARVSEAQVAITYMCVYAPFDGTILTKDADPGETIMPGGMGAASGRGSVVQMADLDKLDVDTDIKEDYLSRLRRGQPAEIVVDAVASKRYKGVLREIIPMGDRARGIVKVKVQVLDPDESLFPELGATVHFLPESQAKAAGSTTQQIYIPESAVVKEGEVRFAWKIENDKAVKAPVKLLGEPKEGLIAIEPGGLSGGETLILDPPYELRSGETVRQAGT